MDESRTIRNATNKSKSDIDEIDDKLLKVTDSLRTVQQQSNKVLQENEYLMI